ncbi:hypothetical protein B0H67DRAFT_663978 [Lasiosphaeris hirsuta]|uniref:Fungal N-terminal domain-containing protein n=1 Tax=Lasiosphaeris hirsuta TaxID=260670 RepID=A0AA40AER3_9PEZI|nr:hypothetical protein B0H67DRAFT_663978 [Lasiosphaeris hirsuta]
MADPLTITGGVVGITSLGIQVCQIFDSYLRSLQGRKQQIASDLREVQALISVFYSLNGLIPAINAIKAAVDRVDIASLSLDRTTVDLARKVHENSDELRSLQRTIDDTRENIERRLARTEWSVRDLNENISGKLTMAQTGIQSASSSLVEVRKITELLERLDGLPDRIEGMPPSSNFSARSQSQLATSPKESRGAVPLPARSAPPITCTCSPKEASTRSHKFNFGSALFHFDEQKHPQHERGCKLYGINRNVKRDVKAQIPLKLGWLFTRITLASVQLSTGAGDPWIMVRFRNIVPKARCPVRIEILELKSSMDRNRNVTGFETELVQRVESCERAVLSLFRDRKASPEDRDEFRESHATGSRAKTVSAVRTDK